MLSRAGCVPRADPLPPALYMHAIEAPNKEKLMSIILRARMRRSLQGISDQKSSLKYI
jgi:hypothetical protein